MAKRRRDGGYTLVELLLVIVVLGILATVVVASVGGFTAEAEEKSCMSDSHLLYTATEAFFADRGVTVIPPDGSDVDRFERRLVTEGFLRAPSKYYDLDAAGMLSVATGSPCEL